MSQGRKAMGSNRFLHRIVRLVDRFRRDRSGNVLVIVGAAIIPLVGALGLATDASRAYLVKARLSQALDTAVLAGAKVYFSPARNDDVKRFFRANFPTTNPVVFDTLMASTQAAPNFMEADVTLNTPVQGGPQGKETLTLDATAEIPTTFMRVLGFKTVTVTAEAQATRAIQALDLVLSFDMSASMKNPQDKILKSRDAALGLLDILFGTDNNTSPTFTVDGTTYNMLRVGFVPWNAEVNIRVQSTPTTLASITPVNPKDVGNKTNPVTGQSQTKVYYAGTSTTDLNRVPLLMDPRTPAQGGQLPGGWTGCVYARYLGDNDNTNDGDLEKGAVVKNGKDWFGYEPEASDDGEPRSNGWSSSEAPSGTRWASGTWNTKNCNNAYFNDAGSNLFDNADGSVKSSPSPYSSTNTSRPAAVPNPKSNPSSTYSGTFTFIDPTTSYAKPAIGGSAGNPSSSQGGANYDCTACLTRGIIPLTPNKANMKTLLQGIVGTDPNGNTNTLQGLYWAWEVLMPGEPFDNDQPTVPFKRTRAIVLLTDGELFIGSSGDAYRGRFGYHEIAGTNTDPAHGQINLNGTMVQNNLDNRLKAMAKNIKDDGVEIYIVAFNIADQYDLDRLRPIASEPTSEYFYEAPTTADLAGVFNKIAAKLSTVRLSM